MDSPPRPPNNLEPHGQHGQSGRPEGAAPDQIPFSLPSLIEESAATAAVSASEKGLDLRCFVANDVPARLIGDPARLGAVLDHLLRNAVRFTEAGDVRLDVRLDSDPADPGEPLTLRFSVIDTGIGLDRKTSARLFEDSEESDGAGAPPGSLKAVRGSVRLMGGDLQVHSSPGEGATFWFTAPFGFEQAAATAPAPEARRMRILIAEDNPVNQLVLAAQLHVLGHASFTVINGHEALAALDRGSWDAAFLDCQMPLLDGYQTIAAIRKREAGTPRHLWVTAISANALEGQREICLRAGMDDFIPKPFDTQQLAQAIARIPCPSLDARPPVDAGRLQELASSKSTSGANLLEKMTTLFLGSGAEILDQMDAAIETGDFPTTARAAHKLGGGCSYFGARELHALCIETEQLARSSDPAVLRNIAPRIRQEYLRVAQALRQNSPGQPVSA